MCVCVCEREREREGGCKFFKVTMNVAEGKKIVFNQINMQLIPLCGWLSNKCIHVGVLPSLHPLPCNV